MNRFERPIQGKNFTSEYDLPSDEVWDIQNRGVGPVKVITQSQINLAKAGTLFLNESGYGFVFYVQNATTGEIYTEARIDTYVNAGDSSDPSRAFPGKTGRGYFGAFQQLFLSWPQDSSGTYNVSFVIFKSKQYPWIGGEEAT